MLRPGRAATALVWLALSAGCTPAPGENASEAASPAGHSAAQPSATAAATQAPPSPRACEPVCRARPRTVGRFRTALAPEASGIAGGSRNPRLLYVVDDGPGTTSLLVVRARDGRALGRLHVEGLEGIDTEDLAVGPCEAGATSSCIYVGDIGDNLEARDSIRVTRVAEPDLSAGVPDTPVSSDSVTWQYPDEPHDAEALLVGPDASLTVITKAAGRRGRGAARLYTADRFADVTLRRGRRLRLPLPGLPFAAAVVGNVVTAADATAGRVVVRTYDALYEFTAPGPGSPVPRFPTWPRREITAPPEGQGEAVAYAPDGCGLFTVSEGSGAVTAMPCR